MIDKITNHIQQAKDRLISQYKDKPNIASLIEIYGEQIQELEDVFFQLITERSIETSVGAQLDGIGDILNEPRNGLDDGEYRIILIGKIAEINSEGTIEDLIGIYSILMRPSKVILAEQFPAKVQLTAVAPNPIGDVSLVLESLNKAKAAGIGIEAVSTPEFYFSFLGDTDGDTFGTLTDAGIGGNFSELI